MVNNSSALNNNIDSILKKIKKIEKDLNSHSKKIKEIESWKKQFNLDTNLDKNNIKEKIPFVLLNIMNNVNNLNDFKHDIEAGSNTLTKLINNKRSINEIGDDSDYSDLEEEYEENDINKNQELEKYIKILDLYNNYNNLVKKDKIMFNDYFKVLKENKKLSFFCKNDFVYFIGCSYKEKSNIVSIEKSLYALEDTKIPDRYKILNSDLPIQIKKKCLDKYNSFKMLDVGSGEYNKLNNWITGLISIPWGIYKEIAYTTYKNNFLFLKESMDKLDKSIYGQRETKQNIIQLVSKLITNPKSVGNVFSIYGPMGTGKTTIIKDGLSKILGLPFIFISLGGATDSSFLDGHSYTYEGSIPGRIIEGIKQSKCMNPIIYFDELDKVSDTAKGKEIINLLIHLTDPSQNSHFQDKYYGDVSFDLSKSIFIFSFNDKNIINPILKDRMKLIEVKGFNFDEKYKISKNFMLPEILKTYELNNSEIIFKDENIKYLINKTNDKEKGVRTLKRNIENIISIFNVLKLSFLDKKNNKKNNNKKIKLDNNLNKENLLKILPYIQNKNIDNIIKKIKIPFEIDKEIIDLFYKNNKPNFAIDTMYI